MPSIIDDSDKLKQEIIKGLLDDIPDIEERILAKIYRVLDEYSTKGGNFVNEKTSVRKLASLQKEVESILEEAGYFRKANIFIEDLGKITQNTIDLQKGLNDLNIQKRSLTPIERLYAGNTANALAEGGLNQSFVRPVSDTLLKAITYGYSVQSTRDELERLVTGSDGKLGLLNRYLTTTARDTVSQLQGEQQRAIQQEYDMPYLRYVGGLLNDSRGQCVHWKKMEYIAVEELASEIDQAFKNQKAKLEYPKGHRWSGMIEGTNVKNFLVYRGGWGCMHTAVPVLKKP